MDTKCTFILSVAMFTEQNVLAILLRNPAIDISGIWASGDMWQEFEQFRGNMPLIDRRFRPRRVLTNM